MKGTMSERGTRRTPDGSTVKVWRLRVVTGYEGDKPVQRSKTVTGTKREAETALARFVARAEEGAVPTSGAITFGRYLSEVYLPGVRERLSPETYRNHASRINGRIIRDLGSVRLDRLTARQLDRAYARWHADGLAVSTVRAHHLVISASLSQAVRWELVPRSVASLVQLPTVDRREPTLPTLQQIADLVRRSSVTDPVLSTAIMLAALTGCRRGELCGLQWQDIDRDALILQVRRATKRGDGGEKLIGATKAHTTRRISIDQGTLAVFDAHRGTLVAAGIPVADHDHVLTWGPSGAPANPDVVTTRFARLTRKTGCPQVRFHDLRHAVATTLLANGTDVATVAARLGHASPVTTMRVYAHVLEAHDRQAAEVMGAMLAATNAE